MLSEEVMELSSEDESSWERTDDKDFNPMKKISSSKVKPVHPLES
jgi:hypothetical protein